MKIMLVMTNYAKNYASTIFQSLVLGCGYPNRRLPWTWRYWYKWTRKLSLPAEAVSALHLLSLFLYPKLLFVFAPIHSLLKVKNAEKGRPKNTCKKSHRKKERLEYGRRKTVPPEVADSPVFFDILILWEPNTNLNWNINLKRKTVVVFFLARSSHCNNAMQTKLPQNEAPKQIKSPFDPLAA